MATQSITIPDGWNGPASSANGGVAAGVMAVLSPGASTVRLHAPPPMGRPLAIQWHDGTHTARDGDLVVLTATVASAPALCLPRFDRAAVSDGVPFPGHPAMGCMVCGPDHPAGLRVFPAPVASPDAQLAATWWSPPAWSLLDDDTMDMRLVWGVLDCPGALAVMDADEAPMFAALGSITGVVHRAPHRDEKLLVLGWTLPPDGRKRPAGTALITEDGEMLAQSHQITIAVPASFAAPQPAP
jgi:hypothetical protein